MEGFIPTVIDLTLPGGWTAGAVRWPEAHEFRFEVGAETLFVRGYQGRVLAVIPIDIMVRRRTDCYCATGTFYSLVITILAAIWLGGPGVAILYLRRRRRLANVSCVRCGYPKGPSPSPLCPECGYEWGRS